MATTYDVDGLFAALAHLLHGRERGLFSDTEFAKCVAESGPLLSCEVQLGVAKRTDHTCFVYKAADHVTAFLATVIARHGALNNPSQFASNGIVRPNHDPTVSEPIQSHHGSCLRKSSQPKNNQSSRS
jgi:hypothetical protein